MHSPTAPVPLDAYQLRLPSFEGPLDVLLRLIEREQLAITDISLVTVTEQFFAHLREHAEKSPALMAEFAAVGARLVLLKSRSLLPRRPDTPEEPEPDDLVRQLTEYRALKDAAHVLASWDREARGGFDRGSAIVLPVAPAPRLAVHPPGSLARALRRRLTSAMPPAQALMVRRVVTLRHMSERLLALLQGDRVSFATARALCADREEVMVSFLALLVLIRRRVVDAHQDTLFGDIAITRTATADSAAPALLVEPGDFEPTG